MREDQEEEFQMLPHLGNGSPHSLPGLERNSWNKKVEQIFHKPQVPPVLDILEMNGNGVSKHIVVAIFLACTGGYVA